MKRIKRESVSPLMLIKALEHPVINVVINMRTSMHHLRELSRKSGAIARKQIKLFLARLNNAHIKALLAPLTAARSPFTLTMAIIMLFLNIIKQLATTKAR